ncbi:hypothetical protein CPC16_001468 [Podila verticillata]|nr:hypothetical protein CPC16_001468 [Podila verticillata]KAI9235841.1 MAG: hypothetical protein BYD32DRAFT_463088 [Podila humilis]
MHSEILAMPVHPSTTTLDDEDSDDDYWGQYGDREDTPVAKGPEDNDNDIFSSAPISPVVTFSTTLPWAPMSSSAAVVDGQDEDDGDDEYWQKYGGHSEDEDEDEEDQKAASDISAHSLHEEGAVGLETRRIFASVDPLTISGETCPGGSSFSTLSQAVLTAPSVVGVNPTTLASLLERLIVEDEDEEKGIPDGGQEEDQEKHVNLQHEEKRFPLFSCAVGQGQQGRGELAEILEEGDNNHKDAQGQGEKGQLHERISLSLSRSRLQSLSGPASEAMHRAKTTTTTTTATAVTTTTTPLSLSEGALSGMVVQDQNQRQQHQQAPQNLAHPWDLSQISTPHSCVEEETAVSEKENNNDNINNVGMKHGETESCGTFRSRSSSSSTVVSDPVSASMPMSKAQILDSLKSLAALALQAGLSKADLVQMLGSVS